MVPERRNPKILNLDAIVKRRNIRALVFYCRSGLFYVNGRPQGIYYEALGAFEQSVIW
jgi:hypothetical protein